MSAPTSVRIVVVAMSAGSSGAHDVPGANRFTIAAGSPGSWGPSTAAHAEPQYGDVSFSTQNYKSHQCIYKLSSGCNYGGCSGRVHGDQAYPGHGSFATSSSVKHWSWSSTAQSGFGCYFGTVPSTVPGNMLGAGNPTPTVNAAATSVLYRE